MVLWHLRQTLLLERAIASIWKADCAFRLNVTQLNRPKASENIVIYFVELENNILGREQVIELKLEEQLKESPSQKSCSKVNKVEMRTPERYKE